jgi:aspartyl/asparaginyl-tRNA synthetase
VVKLTFEEGIQLLKENGIEWPVMQDLDTETEKKLGEIGTFSYI